MISDYVVAIGGSFDIENAIEAFLAMAKQYVHQGYEPCGGINHAMTATPATTYHVFCQAFVREVQRDPIVITSRPREESGDKR